MKTYTFLTILLAAVFGAALAIAQQPVAASRPARARDPQVQRAHDRYQATNWPRTDRRAGFDLGSFKIHNYEGSAVESIGENATARRFNPTGEKQLFLVESWVFDTTDAAHEKLIEMLAFVSSPGTLPTAQSNGTNSGDIGYIGFSGAAPGRISWMGFVRANIVVRITNLNTKESPAIDAAAIALLADSTILSLPKLLENQPVPRPKIDKLAFGVSSVAAGAVVPLELAMTGAGASPVIEWIVGGPGQGYVERGASGAFELHTTGAGRIELGIQVTSPMGTTGAAKAFIEVKEK